MAKICCICGTWGNHQGQRCPLYRLNEQQEALGRRVTQLRKVKLVIAAILTLELEHQVTQLRRAWLR